MTKVVGRLCRVLATGVFREEALAPGNHPVNAAKGWNYRGRVQQLVRIQLFVDDTGTICL